ncbi:MAG: ATP-binding protein [Paludibacteraceae bacterium]|nr:ATP-binding protein [Paludibacteraceae bacterium]
MCGKYLYPVDTDQFEDIRERGLLYVDKTGMLFDLVSKYRYVFLSRPRRFGKSLLCNTFRAYFNGEKELFEGLKIASLEKEWKKYPVLQFAMSGLKHLDLDEAREKLGLYISEYERFYGCNSSKASPGARFRNVIHAAHEKSGEKVVVLIDEYDSPILALLHQPEERDAMRRMMREFFQVLKDEGAHIRFVFMTGITKFSQMSIFSELNNLKNISMMPEYSGLCGITKTELETTLRPHVADLAERMGCTTEEAYAKIKEYYDGYHFCEESEDIYAPYSLLNALNDGKVKEFWFESGTSSSLMENLKHYPLAKIMSYDGVDVNIKQFAIPCEEATTPMPLLFQSGYLSIDRYNREMDTYTLHFPNKEVRNGLIDSLMPLILHQTADDKESLVLNMTRCIYNGDLSGALHHLQAYIAGIPYDIITKEEWDDKEKREGFYKLLMYMVFSILTSKVRCESKCILGRADVVIGTAKDVFVLELKVDDTVENALRQIDDKSYAIQWSADGRRVTKCGVRIDSERRNITHWRLVDGKNETIEEKTFTVGQ